jgi:hypothetical protein
MNVNTLFKARLSRWNEFQDDDLAKDGGSAACFRSLYPQKKSNILALDKRLGGTLNQPQNDGHKERSCL